jgi:deoxyribose-phosphate aldolase
MDAQRLEDILTEIGRRLLERGASGPEGLDPWGCATVSVEVCPESVDAMVRAGACRLGVCGPDPARLGDVASYLDHTLLKPDATAREIDQLCSEALEHRFASVCVNGTWVRRCAEVLAGSGVLVCTVVGFPLGAAVPEVKAYEARRAIEDGACEVDMVLNVGALRSGDHAFVRRDVAAVGEVVHRLGARLKVILETCLLEAHEIAEACRLCKEAGADFVKTSTGFSKGGATVADVELMRRVVGPTIGVKASGGVRDRATADAMIEAGATRIGASASVAIVRGGA